MATPENTETQGALLKLVAQCGDQTLGVFKLADGGEVTLGASANAECHVSGEKFLSRRHAVLRTRGNKLEVERLESARNPLLFKGAIHDRFRMNPGDFFVIGETRFRLVGGTSELDGSRGVATMIDAPAPAFQFTLGVEELQARRGTSDRMRLLDLMELPEVLRTRSREEFFVYACGLLRTACEARWVRVLAMDEDGPVTLAEDAGVDQLTEKPLSRELAKSALAEEPKPVAYCWSDPLDSGLEATAHEGIDWAISCAMPVPGERPKLFYVAGATRGEPGQMAFDSPTGSRLVLRDTTRLVGLVADMIGRAISLQKLELWQSRLGHFFSDKLVRKILESDAQDELAPRIAEATIMFFDIRGFSEMTEDRLESVLDHQEDLKRVFTAMTQCVFDHDGVVIRYMGDGILCCWNVPYAIAEHVDQACLAAIEMVETMQEVTDGWKCGIALGVGEVVAGSLGSEQVYAYDILGAAVNQTARVEGITKIVGVPILVTGEIAGRVSSDQISSRRVARFRPVGMETEVDLFTIQRTPDDAQTREEIEARFAVHAQGLEAFEKGDWDTAFSTLHPIVQDDPAAMYVYKLTLGYQSSAPRNWRGVIELTTKQ